MVIYITALLCVFGLVAGQLLFKMSANAIVSTGSYLSLNVLISVFSAMLLYFLSSLAWIWVLQKIELGKIYPLMALAFILVPLSSHIILGERFNNQYYMGVSLIIVGIVIIVKN